MIGRKTLLSLCLIGFSVQLAAQKGTNSPYSVFGIGELGTNQFATFVGMGGVQMANADSTNINYMNPATYAYIMRHRPIFSVGVNGKFSRFETSDSFVDKRTGGLNQFQIGVPIKKRWGAAIGLMPYSFSGYTVSNFVIEDEDTLQQFVNEGTGGISQVYLGVSCKAIDFGYRDTSVRKRGTFMVEGKSIVRRDTNIIDKRHVLALGFNTNFLFGSAIRKQSYEYVWPITGYNARAERSLRVSDLNVDIGLNYQYFFETDSSAGSFSLGAAYTPPRKMRAFEDVYAYNYLGSFYEPNRPVTVFDTVEFIDENQGVLLIPETYKLGIEYRFGPGRNSSSQLRLAADVKYQKWSNYYMDFGPSTEYDELKDRLSMGVGLEYTPATRYGIRSSTSSFLGKIRYRIGFNYTQTEWQVENDLGTKEQITDYGMSFGLGIPITTNFQNTNINFGATFGNLGKTDNGLIQQRYIGIYFGLSLSPGRGNFWFVKRKYD